MKKIKVGLLINDEMIPSWTYEMLRIIHESNHSEIVLIIKKNVIEKKSNNSNEVKLKRFFKTFFWRVLKSYDNLLNNTSNNAFENKNIYNLLKIDTLNADVKETKFSDYITKESLIKIKKYNLDVLIRLGFRILRGEILKLPKFGVWSFHHGDNSINRGGPPGVWEVILKIPVTGATLQILNEDLDGGNILSKTFSSTENYSFLRNKNKLYWKALYMIPRKLNELYTKGGKIFTQNLSENNNGLDFYNEKLFLKPDNKTSLKFLFNVFIQLIKTKIFNKFYFNQWILLYKISEKDGLSKSFFRFKRITPAKDRFWADPFILEQNDIYYIFFEELIFNENRGKISLIKMDKKGNYSKPLTVLEEKFHLSYPFVFKEKDSFYMIPETKEKNSINIYECVQFPYKWKHKKILIPNISAVDSTLLKHGDRFWIFCNVVNNNNYSNNDELYIYFSESLLDSSWTPHPMNPVVSDVRSARPAGKIFKYKNKIYRPSQDCSKRYGHSVKFNQIVKINENVYEEIVVDSILPNWSDEIVCSHTFNNSGRLTVIDAQIKRFKF
tara:strand:+ start:757 stop:2418 length:1662 start_codon:yes stop_codon:yes gene_type:complete